MIFTDLFESFDNNSSNLELGDEVIVTYHNQFQGKRGEITGFGRDRAFVIVEIDGREYSMHSSDVERLGNEQDWDDEDELNEYGSAHDKVTFEVDSENAYNHIMQKYGNVIDWAGDYMTVPTRYWPAVQELAFAAGGDVQEIELSEEIDTGEYDARKSTPSSKEDNDRVFKNFRERLKKLHDEWPDEQGVAEGAEFGAYYYEQLAQKVFDENPNLSTKGRADDLFKAGWKYAVQDLGKKRAQWEFGYDEDFPSDFVSAYAELQRGEQLDELSPETLKSYRDKGDKDIKSLYKASGTTSNNKKLANRLRGWGQASSRLNEGLSTDQLAGMIAARLERLAPNVFTDYGVEYVLDAVRDVAEFYAMSDFEELGTSDLGAMARSVVKNLKQREAHMNRGA